MYICYVSLSLYIYIYIYVYKYTHTHTRIHTYAQKSLRVRAAHAELPQAPGENRGRCHIRLHQGYPKKHTGKNQHLTQVLAV